MSAFNNQWVFDGEFADLAKGLGFLLELLSWVKLELQQDEETLFYYLTNDEEAVGKASIYKTR